MIEKPTRVATDELQLHDLVRAEACSNTPLAVIPERLLGRENVRLSRYRRTPRRRRKRTLLSLQVQRCCLRGEYREQLPYLLLLTVQAREAEQG